MQWEGGGHGDSGEDTMLFATCNVLATIIARPLHAGQLAIG